MSKTGKAASKTRKKASFEESLGRLEEIVEQLEGGELPLEKAIELFEKGVDLGRACGSTLDQAEKRISVLLERADGVLDEAAFEPGDTDDEED